MQLRVIQTPPMPGDPFCHGPMTRFLKHLQNLLLWSQQKLSPRQPLKKPANFDYVWMQYSDMDRIPAYAVMLLVNKEGYVGHCPWGKDPDTLVYRIRHAWLTALQAPACLADKAVIIQQNNFRIMNSSPDHITEAFRIASYCCQATDEDYGVGHIPFGCSRPSKNATYS